MKVSTLQPFQFRYLGTAECIGHTQAGVTTIGRDGSNKHAPRAVAHVAFQPSSIPLPLQPLNSSDLPNGQIRVFELKTNTYLWLTPVGGGTELALHVLAVGGIAIREVGQNLGWDITVYREAEEAWRIYMYHPVSTRAQSPKQGLLITHNNRLGSQDEFFLTTATALGELGRLPEVIIPRRWLVMDEATAHLHDSDESSTPGTEPNSGNSTTS